jgi:hypothetical protein
MQTSKRRLPPEAKPFVWAAALAAGYLFGLHPASGPLGGLAFFFLGWLIPTTIQLLIAFGIARLFRLAPSRQILIFITALVGTIVLPSTGRLVEWVRSNPTIEVGMVDEGQDVPNLREDLRTALVIYDNPWLSRWTFGGNEACGCLYFEASDASNYLNRLDILILKMGLRDKFANMPFRKNLPNGYRLVERVEPDGEDRINLVLAVYHYYDLRGVFRHRHLPKSLLGQKPRPDWRNLDEDFLNRAGDMLLRASLPQNIFAYIGPDFFPDKELTEFIRATILTRQNAN